MAVHETRFEFADKGPTSVYKFHFPDDDGDPTNDVYWVWFEYAGGGGSLFRTPGPGPYKAEDDLEPAPHNDLDRLLAEHGTTKRQWIEDLLAQYGERISWTYP